MIFKKKEKSLLSDTIKKSKYYVPYNSTNPFKTYEVSDEEEKFFDILLEKSSRLKGEYQLSRLSDGTVNVSYKGYPIGKIKFQGRKKRMQVLSTLYDNDTIEGTFDDFIQGIDIWLKYINGILKES